MSESEEVLLEKIKTLESENKTLKEQKAESTKKLRTLETKELKQNVSNRQLEGKIKELKGEINSFKKTPLILATITEVFDDNRVGIRGHVGHDFVVTYPGSIDKSKVIPGARVSLNQDSLAVVEVLPSRKEADIIAMEIEEKPDIDYDDIGGLENAIVEVKETVELPIKKPELFEEIGIDPPKGILLYGPPGTGKTLLAKAVANQTNATFIKLVASEFVNKFLGEGSRYVREVFELAKEKSPAIIFIDEIDAIGTKRTHGTQGADREVQRTLMQLLSELDGFESRGNVGIIAATNRPDILDNALIRPGRFDRAIEVPLPNKIGRQKILEIHTQKMKIDENIDFDSISELTEGFSGADLKAICTEAGMYAIRSERKKVISKDFMDAIDKIMNQI
ncbi:MAG: proteasome-activating nucleotidase [Methanobrevibacter sp.]|uniref:Proteasome-activating nucleotidase n=1 Tax=Methanobrevibacter millerae TaxID=230361 RepID=A0A8T3VP85_9EURY|nr:proteasome-activating nucleotidase [Methanobrevibacter sp.]MBE6509856.1 AAA family ATPase [Methanobrevibacter millerae]MBO5150655.1 proteasome-activating nucleotidase [Methanobrevibacter sp.]